MTAQRRAAEFAAALERRGATVLQAPTIDIVPLSADGTLCRATGEVLAQGVDVLVVTTGAGFRGWLDAADGWGVGTQVREMLGGARIVVR